MRFNKWILITLAINIGLFCLSMCVLMKYQHRNDIVKSQHPITDYSISEVNCSSDFRGGSTIKIVYSGKNYYVGISRKQCKGIMSTTLYYDRLHDTVFEKDELSMRHVVFFCTVFAFSLLLWTHPEVRKINTRKP